MGFELDKLNKFSLEYANMLFLEFPILRDFSKVDNDDGEYYFYIEYPCADNKNYLYISTDDDEITIGFGFYHDHFYDFIESINFINDIINEKIVVVKCEQDSKWTKSYCVDVNNLSSETINVVKCDTKYILSWKGTYNKILKIDDKKNK
ncbi:hypothetical protein KHQ81_04925 [Mycoplasmatota bacterium]|nr:hypothetical protein KHQ81_04925 [Mycoplasmatota bacterium]